MVLGALAPTLGLAKVLTCARAESFGLNYLLLLLGLSRALIQLHLHVRLSCLQLANFGLCPENLGEIIFELKQAFVQLSLHCTVLLHEPASLSGYVILNLSALHCLCSQQPLGSTRALRELRSFLCQDRQLGRQRVCFLSGGCCFQGLDCHRVLLLSYNVALS